MSLSINTFATEDDAVEGRFSIQWQFPTFLLNCTATDLGFAPKIIALVDETRANPAYRDIPLGGGRFRHMVPKGIDVSEHFEDLSATVHKCGECDHGYDLHFEAASDFFVNFHLASDELDHFLYGLKEMIEDNLVEPNTNTNTST